MPITFRHDAAAVVLPSTNEAGTKYGQSLVLQQQQQKYDAQQAGYDRMFTLGRDQQQQMQEAMRQGQQNAANTIRDVNQNVFQQQRDKMLFEQQQQQQEAARQQAFMDEARKQSSGMIMDDIKNGYYDTATATKLRQNLLEESEALSNPTLDATQRAEVLQKYRAARSLLTANRIEPPPKPTAQDQFNQGIVTDPETGQRYRQNAKGDYEPIQQQPTRPTSADEAFMADQKVRDKYMAEAKEMVAKPDEFGKPKPLDEATRKEAAELAKKLYEEDNGLGTPTTAPALPGSAAPTADWSGGMLGSVPGAPTPAVPGEQRSILETPQSPAPAAVPADEQEDMWTVKMQALDQPPTAEQYKSMVMEITGSPMDSRLSEAEILQIARRIWNNAQETPAQPAPASPAAKPPMPLTSNASSQNTQAANPWAEVASGGESAPQSPVSRDMALAPGHPNYKPIPTPTGQVDANGYVIMSDGSKLDPRDSAAMKSGGAQTQDVVRLTNPDGSPIEDDGSKKVTLEGLAQTPVVPQSSAQAGQPSLQVPKANFGKLLSNATDDADRTVIGNLQGMYNSQPPEVQSAIDAFVNPGSTKVQRAEALLALREAGIDVRELAAQPKKPPNRMSNQGRGM